MRAKAFSERICIAISGAAMLFCISCREPEYIYELNNEVVSSSGIEKKNLKSESEFISIGYSDLFDKPISSSELEETKACFESVNDKEIIRDMYIRDLIKRNNTNIPSNNEMRSDAGEFVINAYKKLFHRNPNEYELWYMTNLVNTDTSYSAKMIYYAMMSSEEYKYY
jgi:hypothetical protein